MKKKIKDLESLFTKEKEKEIIESFQKIIIPCIYDAKDHFDIYPCNTIEIFKDGESKFACLCTNCKDVVYEKYASSNNEKKCAKCGKTNIFNSYGKDITKSYYYSNFRRNYRYPSEYDKVVNKNFFIFVSKKSDEDIFFISIVKRGYSQKAESGNFFDIENLDKNEFLNSPLFSNDEIIQEYIYCEEFGLRTFDLRTRFLFSPSNNTHKEKIKFLTDTEIIISNNDLNLLLDILNKKNNSNERNLIKEINQLSVNKEVKAYSNKKIISEKYDIDNICNPLTTEDIKKIIYEKYSDNLFFHKLININGTKRTFAVGCFCGNGEEIIVDVNSTSIKRYLDEDEGEELSFICSKCGKTHYFNTSNKDIESIYFDSKLFEKNDEKEIVIARYIKIKYFLNYSYLSKILIENNEFDETKRIIFDKQKISIYSKRFSSWQKDTLKSIDKYEYIKNTQDYCINTYEDISEIVKSTFLDKTGLTQAWGLKGFENYLIEGMGKISADSYLYNYYKKPYLEFLIKSKLKLATNQLQKADICEEYLKSKNVQEMFNISKSVFKIAAENNLNVNDIISLKNFYEYQTNFSKELWDEISAININKNYLLSCCKTSDSKVSRILEYLDSCYNNQCIEKVNALSIWIDYYEMAKNMGYNMSDNSIKFPNSLKKEHDKASFAYKVVENEIKLKAFRENTLANKKYQFEDKDFIVIVPENPEEIIREGQEQKHCVASYVQKIEKGITCVCFIRQKEQVNKAYFTCEIYDEKIFQVKAFQNRYPSKESDLSLIEFINKWAKKKNLTIEYMKH